MQIPLRGWFRALPFACAIAACETSASPSTSGRDGAALPGLPPCSFRLVSRDGWIEVSDSRGTFALSLPPGAKRMATSDEPTVLGMWEIAAGNVSLSERDWGASWQDSVRSDFADAWPLCDASTQQHTMSIRSRYAAPHPLGQGQYLMGYVGLASGKVLVLRAYASDSSAIDTLFTIAAGLEVPRARASPSP